MIMTINYIYINNFKSLSRFRIKNIRDFSAFAGSNGSGKSNFFDALGFISQFVGMGLDDAVSQQGGYQNFKPIRTAIGKAYTLDFKISCNLAEKHRIKKYVYKLTLKDIGLQQSLEIVKEELFINNRKVLSRNWQEMPTIRGTTYNISHNHSALLLFDKLPIRDLLENFRIYRILPYQAPALKGGSQNKSALNMTGSNLSSVLQRLAEDRDIREEILDWMEQVVPGLEKITAKNRTYNSETGILFKEQGTRKPFPAHMVSDGTIYFLSMLVAVLDTPKEASLILLEEPEQGLHPKVIIELVNLLREAANNNNLIWITTHSETLVRQLSLDELWLVNKKRGKTYMKHASDGNLQQEDLAPLGLDEVWLSDLLGSGNPW
jgi:predicted ATPase